MPFTKTSGISHHVKQRFVYLPKKVKLNKTLQIDTFY